MKKKLLQADSNGVCPVDFAFKRIGGKYKGRILWYIHKENGVLRYGELRRAVYDCTTKMLTQSLRELEDDGLVVRTVYREVPPKVEYSLSRTGKELIPFIDHLHAWAIKEMSGPSSQMRHRHPAKIHSAISSPTGRHPEIQPGSPG